MTAKGMTPTSKLADEPGSTLLSIAGKGSAVGRPVQARYLGGRLQISARQKRTPRRCYFHAGDSRSPKCDRRASRVFPQWRPRSHRRNHFDSWSPSVDFVCGTRTAQQPGLDYRIRTNWTHASARLASGSAFNPPRVSFDAARPSPGSFFGKQIPRYDSRRRSILDQSLRQPAQTFAATPSIDCPTYHRWKPVPHGKRNLASDRHGKS